MLNCIAGLLQPDAGRVSVGSQVFFDSDREINLTVAERNVGYLFQDLALFPHLNVQRNLEYGLTRLPRPQRRDRIEKILESFRIAHLKNQKPNQISGGERQRVALARSLVTDPTVLLLDEPLAALDAITRSKIIEDLRAWNAAHQIPIIHVTHSPEEAFALGERVIVLDAGKVIAQGTPQQVLDAPRVEMVAQLAGFENIFDATIEEIHEASGTMLCRLDGSEIALEVPLVRAAHGTIRIAIRAGDIMLATTKPVGLSARNVFQATLSSLHQQGATVIASMQSGVGFEVHLTPNAREDLALRVGQQIWVVIKTYSCHPANPR